MNNTFQNVVSIIVAILSAIGAAFSFLPYGWGHVASGAIFAGITALYGGATVARNVVRQSAVIPPAAAPDKQ